MSAMLGAGDKSRFYYKQITVFTNRISLLPPPLNKC